MGSTILGKLSMPMPRFDKPDDGLPVLDDWLTTFESMLFAGIELGRKPLDCTMNGGGPVTWGDIKTVLNKHKNFPLSEYCLLAP